MYKNVRIISLVFLMILASSCKDESTQLPVPVIRELSVNETEVAGSANNFTFDLMAEIENQLPNENYFISSFSVSTALSMVMNGATEGSKEEFIRFLGFEGMSAEDINEAYKSLTEYIYSLDPSVTLNVANSNWYSDKFTIKSDFANTLQSYYDAEIFERNFGDPATLASLNGWVENETNGKIKDILEAISPDEVMFLVNAIYFKAIWTNPFDAAKTADLPFTLATGASVNVPMMVGQVKHWLSFDETLKAQIIEIPYGNENYAFTIILPQEASDINNIISSIDVNTLNNAMKDSLTLVRDLYLPKFQLDFKADLKDLLVGMGMPLTGLDNLFEESSLPLKINKVIHQSFLEVNEEGSEAAAATVVGIELTTLPPATAITRPFIFLIRERNSGTILFSGKLMDPR